MCGAAAVAGVLSSGRARAQAVDENPPLPNVLLLVDNSGSMERMINGDLPEANTAANAPSVCVPGTASNPNRWGIALQTLTGNITPYYSCYSEPRSSTNTLLGQGSITYPTIDFVSEYSINGKAPYDANYVLPYHRPLTGPTNGSTWTIANSCELGPARLPGVPSGQGVGPNFAGSNNGYPTGSIGQYATDFPNDAIAQRLLGSEGSASSCTGWTTNQQTNGALDNARDYIRFGLMTFDQDPGPGVGVSGSSGAQVVSFSAGQPPNTFSPPFQPGK
jgi:type IV pilus assembly protein PilY1